MLRRSLQKQQTSYGRHYSTDKTASTNSKNYSSQYFTVFSHLICKAVMLSDSDSAYASMGFSEGPVKEKAAVPALKTACSSDMAIVPPQTARFLPR